MWSLRLRRMVCHESLLRIRTQCISGLANFVEPCFSVYRTQANALINAAQDLKRTVPESLSDQDIIARNTANCRNREEKFQKFHAEAREALLVIGTSKTTHWRYSIVALRMMRTLVQKDLQSSSPQVDYLLSMTTADHPSLRYVRVSISVSFAN